jgi:uncharacterized protein (DUF1800 family)
VNKQKKIQHLYLRAGFGADYKTITSNLPVEEHLNILFNKAAVINSLSLVDKSFLSMKGFNQLSGPEKLRLSQEAAHYDKELNVAWLNQMTNSDAVLREKMTLFWHGHFACRSVNPFFAQELNNIQRQYAMGKFRDLLLGVSKSPAMLQFLNNKQNRKQHPNENFARELMELFTIGHGNYSERDIKESARAFTGWSFNQEGVFGVRLNQHDGGEKVFMDKTGNFTGEDVIDILLERKETAHFICSKMYRFFVNDDLNADIINAMADSFYKSDYDISALMKTVFLSEWFYDDSNLGSKIKSPVELLIGLNKSFDVKYEDPDVLIHIQNVLGQKLFFPPNVSGWSGGKNWIDSSSLMLRLKLPSIVLNNGIIDIEAKDEPEEYKIQMQEQEKKIQSKVQRKVKASPGWDTFMQQLPKDITKQGLTDFILQPQPPELIFDMISDPGNDHLKAAVIELLSLPEYQMC